MPDIFLRNMDQPLISKDAARFKFIFACDEPDCYWRTSHESWPQAVQVRLNHRASTCPLGSKAKLGRLGNPVGSSVIEKMWIELDAATKSLVETDKDKREAEEYRIMRGKAQGIAHCIWLFCEHHYASVDEVKKWAMERYGMEHKGKEFHPTPGVKGYNPQVALNDSWLADAEVEKRRPPARRAAPAAAAPANPLAGVTEEMRNLATQAIKAGYPDDKVIMLTKISRAALAALKVEAKK